MSFARRYGNQNMHMLCDSPLFKLIELVLKKIITEL